MVPLHFTRDTYSMDGSSFLNKTNYYIYTPGAILIYILKIVPGVSLFELRTTIIAISSQDLVQILNHSCLCFRVLPDFDIGQTIVPTSPARCDIVPDRRCHDGNQCAVMYETTATS